MTRVSRNPNELEAHLKKQVGFLRNSCALYDSGQASEAERIALTLRVLLHHQGSSRSLLVQLGLRETLLFHDVMGECPSSLEPPDSGRDTFMVRFGAGGLRIGGGVPEYVPNLGKPVRSIPFNDWWEQILIIRSLEGINLSRRDIVLDVANTDGGGHVDATIPGNYAAVARNEAFIGRIMSSQRGELQPCNNPIHPSLRQIAHEVIGTLQENVPHLL